MGTVLIIFAFIFVLGPIARAYAQRLTNELPPGADPEQLARLKDEVERLSGEVARLHDEQSFMVRLLSEGERKQLEGRSESPE